MELYNISIIESEVIFEQALRRINSLSGIESICLSKEELFIEYSPVFLTKVSVFAELRKIGFPAKQLELAPVHTE